MRKKIKSALLLLVATLFVALSIVHPTFAKVKVTASQDDIYNKLDEASKLNVIVNNLRKCLNADGYNYYSGYTHTLSGSNAAEGKLFRDYVMVDHSTALWLEDEIQDNGGDDGAFWCNQGQDDGTGVFQLFAEAIGKSYSEILCDGGKGRIITRAHMVHYGRGSVARPTIEDTNCSSFGDSTGANYIRSDNWESGLQTVYEDYKASSGNQYLAPWSSIGNYNNVDGYFNYLRDFNLKCSADKYSSEPSDTTVYPITKFDKEETKITAKTYWYHVTDDKSWKYALSNDNPVKSCSGLLERIETLRSTFNTVSTGYSRDNGYEGIIIQVLKDTCRDLKDSATGESAWTSLKKKLEEVIDSDDATPEQIDKAQDSLTKINNAISTGNYITVTGDEKDDDGKIYQCLDVKELEVTLDEYHYGSEEMGDTESQPDCYTNAGSLGWVVCPLITTGAEMVQTTYEGMVVPFLRMDPQLFSEDNGTYNAWNAFRNIANVAFVIVFLIVIFSQLTGYGIDNYGIKKILPKLIIAAILINMSYIVCQLVIDIANIVGSSIGALFTRLGNEVMSSTPAACSSGGTDVCTAVTGGSGGGAGAWIAIIAVVVAITVAAVLAIGPQILIPVLLAIISFVIAVFFLFVILGIRQALAVLLVAVSPLAFLCYMLPNTKKVFDKWFNTFKGLLIAYPVCSAMVYGGDMVAKIILSAYNAKAEATDLATLTPILSAGVVAVAPIFLIPGVIRKSMGAIGSLAGRLSGTTRGRARGAANRGLRSLPFNNPDNNRFLGFGARAMNQRSRYKRQQREDNVAARQSEYNAKKGNKVLYGKNGLAAKAAAGTLSASDKRKYNRALGAVNAESASNLATYASSYKAMGGDDAIISSVQESLNNGTLTADQLAAATQAIHDEDKVAKLITMRNSAGISVFDKFKGGGAAAVNERQKIADALTGRNGNIFAQSAGKLINKDSNGMNYDDMIGTTSGVNRLREKIQGAGNSIMSSQDKDVFNIAGMGDMFSASQLAAGASAGYTGDTAKSFNDMVGGLSAAAKNDVLDNMTKGEQWGGISSDTLSRLGINNETDLDSLKARNSAVASAVNSFANNTELHGSADAGVLGMAGGASNRVVSTGQYRNASGGGEHTIVQREDGKFYRVDRSGGTVTETEVDIRNFKRK